MKSSLIRKKPSQDYTSQDIELAKAFGSELQSMNEEFRVVVNSVENEGGTPKSKTMIFYRGMEEQIRGSNSENDPESHQRKEKAWSNLR